MYFVSLSSINAKKLASLWHLNTKESEVEKGYLLGYPPDVVNAFVKYSNDPDRGKFLVGVSSKEFPFGEIPYWPYVGFVVRKGFEQKDTEISKVWADFVRKNNPVLAGWYENAIKHSLVNH